MSRKLWRVFAGLCPLAMAAVAVPAGAQMSEVKEKPPMYSYVGFWNIPRAQWGEMEKSRSADQQVLDKAMSSGTIVAYGDDVNLVHQPDGPTHDDWWSAMSMSGLLNVLDQFYKNGSATSSVMESATKHWDGIFVSRYYSWHAGTWKGAYTHGSYYKLKADAPDDSVETLSKNLIVPLMEKMLADGAIHGYEVDTEAIHTTWQLLGCLHRRQRRRPGQSQRSTAGENEGEPARRLGIRVDGGLQRASRLSKSHQRYLQVIVSLTCCRVVRGRRGFVAPSRTKFFFSSSLR